MEMYLNQIQTYLFVLIIVSPLLGESIYLAWVGKGLLGLSRFLSGTSQH